MLVKRNFDVIKMHSTTIKILNVTYMNSRLYRFKYIPFFGKSVFYSVMLNSTDTSAVVSVSLWYKHQQINKLHRDVTAVEIR